jgi:hypothetical protein
MKKLILAVLVSFALLAPSARALEVGVLGGLDMMSVSLSPASTNFTTSSNNGFTIGAFASTGIMPMFDLELQILYATEGYGFTQGTATGSSTFHGLEYPLFLDFHAVPDLLTIGVGPYYTLLLGSVTNSTSAGSATQTFAQANLNSSDFGLAGKVTLAYPVVPGIHVSATAEYLLGLTNLTTNVGTTANTRQLLLLAGVSMGF